MIRSIVLHYVLREGKLEREAPFALSPRDFVDEWIRRDWTISSQWSTAGANALTLRRMHRKENFEGGSYTDTIRCENRPEHWQVGLSWDKFDGGTMVTKRLYFLVRWLPPYRFTLTAINSRPWAACTERDPEADEPRTLFPVHSQ